MNKTIIPTDKQRHNILGEILEKRNAYEARMTTRLARWVEIAELFCGKTSTSKENSKNSPNSTELYKAIRAMANMQMRMLLGQKPPFELECMDILGYDDPNKLIKVEHYITNQMDLARVDKGLYRALTQLLLYGTVVNHYQWEPLRASFLGRKRYITTYRPISLVNCAFAFDAYDVEESGWVCLSDIQSKRELDKLIAHDPDGKVYNHSEIGKAQDESDYAPHVNTWVTQRMAWQGYVNTNFVGGMERITYYGPLECMHDEEEYVVEVINEKYVIRMEAYEGLRPLSITTINTIDVEPLGNGLGDMFRPLLGQIDEAESGLLNMVTLAAANMFAKQKSLTDEDAEFTIRQFGILNLENPALNPIGPDPRNLAAVAGYVDNRTQKFRQASGATDTLQALITEDQATATATSLAMNEAVRNLSVQSQVASPTLLKHWIQVALQNAQKYQTEPFVLHINKAPITVVPADLLVDVNVRIKTTTDQDFRPAKVKNLMAAIQIMDAGGPNAITGKVTDSSYAKMELLKLLDVPNWDKSIRDITEEDMIRANMMAQMQAVPEQGEMEEGGAQGERAMGERPGRMEERTMRKNMGQPQAEPIQKTPIGSVMGAPGDQSSANQSIRQSSAASA